MVSRIIKCIFFYAFFIMLKLCTDKAAFVVSTCVPVKLKHDLSVICGLKNGGDVVQKIPQSCTAIAVNRNPDLFSAVNLIKGHLPLMLIEDSVSYHEWSDILQSDVHNYVDAVKKLGVNVIAFDHLLDPQSNSNDPNFNMHLIKFLKKVRQIYKDMLFGIIVPNDLAIVQNNLDISQLKNNIDFFMVNTTSYRNCLHQNHQSDVEPISMLSDIQGTVDGLQNLKMDTCQMIITIDFEILSVKYNQFSDNDYEAMSYARLCTKEMSKKRKYCFNSIEAIYEKSKYAYDQKMIGVYAQNIEDGDPNGDCKCTIEGDDTTKFPGLRIISQVHKDPNVNVEHFNCVNGGFPTIL